MAENKKSFLIYTDLLPTIEKMVMKDNKNNTNNAGELFLHILKYVNDNNPEPLNDIVELTFESIKQQLKRDLVKYEGKRKQQSDAGKASAEAKRIAKENEFNNRSTDSTGVENRSTDSTDSVNVNDNVKKDITLRSIDFKKTIYPFVDKYTKNTCEAFYDYWSEPSKNGKMKFELQKTWEVSRRLKTWVKNEDVFSPKPKADFNPLQATI